MDDGKTQVCTFWRTAGIGKYISHLQRNITTGLSKEAETMNKKNWDQKHHFSSKNAKSLIFGQSFISEFGC